MAAKDGKYLTFELGGQSYAIDICCIKEILNGCGSIIPVPEFPDYSRGIINLRGDIVPIVDLRRRFHLPELDMKDGKICIIVTESGGAADSDYLGFVVDKVNTVTDFVGKDINLPPKLTTTKSAYVTGVYKGNDTISMILEPKGLLTDSMVEAIDAFMEKQN